MLVHHRADSIETKTNEPKKNPKAKCVKSNLFEVLMGGVFVEMVPINKENSHRHGHRHRKRMNDEIIICKMNRIYTHFQSNE